MTTKTCEYCNRTILNEEVYKIHKQNCSRHPMYHQPILQEQLSKSEYDAFLSHQFLKTTIMKGSDNIQHITKKRLIQLLEGFLYSLSISPTDSQFIQEIIHTIQSNKKFMYSVKEREDIMNYILQSHYVPVGLTP